MLKASMNIMKPTFVSYMAHHIRVTCQFLKIAYEISQFTIKKGGLWIDYKQKILPMKKHKGQIEYFGKRDMSLLGAMLVRRETRLLKGEERIVLAYYFYDVVVNNYSLQDNV